MSVDSTIAGVIFWLGEEGTLAMAKEELGRAGGSVEDVGPGLTALDFLP